MGRRKNDMKAALVGMAAGAAWMAAILIAALTDGYGWVPPLIGAIAGSTTCAMVFFGKGWVK